MKKSKLSNYLIIIAIITFLTVFSLIVENSYSKLMGPIQQAKTNSVMKPIDPNLETDVILQIENREEFLPQNASISTVPKI